MSSRRDVGHAFKKSFLLRPGRYHAGHACVRDKLTHVFIVMNEDSQIHPIYRRFPLFALTFRAKSFAVSAWWASFTTSSDRFSHLITSGFDVTVFTMSVLKSMASSGR